MRSQMSIRAALVVALILTGDAATDAQSNWPTAKPAAAPASVSASAPDKTTKPAPARRRRVTRRRPAAVTPARETELLRSMTEVVSRQAAAIELLARRLEAAEARLAMDKSAPPAFDSAQAKASGPYTCEVGAFSKTAPSY